MARPGTFGQLGRQHRANKDPPPRYLESAQMAGIGAAVIATFVIDVTGRVDVVTSGSAPGFLLPGGEQCPYSSQPYARPASKLK